MLLFFLSGILHNIPIPLVYNSFWFIFASISNLIMYLFKKERLLLILFLFSSSKIASVIISDSNLLSLIIKGVFKIEQYTLITSLRGGNTFSILNFLSGSNKISFSL